MLCCALTHFLWRVCSSPSPFFPGIVRLMSLHSHSCSAVCIPTTSVLIHRGVHTHHKCADPPGCAYPPHVHLFLLKPPPNALSFLSWPCILTTYAACSIPLSELVDSALYVNSKQQKELRVEFPARGWGATNATTFYDAASNAVCFTYVQLLCVLFSHHPHPCLFSHSVLSTVQPPP